MVAPTTPFEDSTSTDPEWTTLAEEDQFITALLADSDRVTSITVGATELNQRPIQVLAVGYPLAPTEAELRDKGNLLVVALQHGNECSGRDAGLQLARDFAYTTDPELQAYLRDHPVMIVPTVNADSFPDTRNNANDKNINREWLSFSEAENQAVGAAIRDYRPHIILDLHEMQDRTNQFEFFAPEGPEVDSLVSTLGVSLLASMDGVLAGMGFTTGLYPPDDDAYYLSNSGALQNIITVLVEASGQTINTTLTRKQAVAGMKAVVEDAVSWHQVNVADVSKAVSEGLLDSKQAGENQIAIQYPNIASPPFGYRLNPAQYAAASVSLDRLRLLAYEIDDGTGDYFVPMAQGTKKLLPLLVDSRALNNIVAATPVDSQPLLVAKPRLVNVRWQKQGSQDMAGAALARDADSVDVYALSPDSSHQWSVQSQEAGRTSNWSEWQPFTTLPQFNLEYRDTETQATTSVPGVSGTSFELTGLEAGESYEFRVQEDDGINTSDWSGWHQFTTTSSGETVRTVDQALAAVSWLAQIQSPVSLTSAAEASTQASAIASVNLTIIEAAQATDATGDQAAAMGSMAAGATGNDTVDALSSAAAAISAGAAAGESWTVQAQVLVNLIEQGAAADEVRRQTESAVTAALESQSLAADQFIAALDSIASLSDSASVTDAYQAVLLELASIASGAVASDSFRMLFGLQRALQEAAVASDSFSISYAFVNALRSGALSGDAWALMVNLNASLSDVCSVADLMSVRASTTAKLTAGAVASSSFAIVNAGVRYLVMGAVILRDALQYRVNTKPALNQSVKIKPGH